MFPFLLSFVGCVLLRDGFVQSVNLLRDELGRISKLSSNHDTQQPATEALYAYANSDDKAGNKLKAKFLEFADSRKETYPIYKANGQEQNVSGMSLLSELLQASNTENSGYTPNWYWKAYASAALSTIQQHRKSQPQSAKSTETTESKETAEAEETSTDDSISADCKHPSKCEPGETCIPGVCREAVTELCRDHKAIDACNDVKLCYQRYHSALAEASDNDNEKKWIRIEFQKLHHSLAEIHPKVDEVCKLKVKQHEDTTTHLDKACFVASAILRHHSKQGIEKQEHMKDHLCEELKHCYKTKHKSADKSVVAEYDEFRQKFKDFEKECGAKY